MLRMLTISLVLPMAGLLVGSTHHSPTGKPSVALPLLERQATTLQHRDQIRGATLRWTWTEGPATGTTHEHDFREDGTVVWRVMNGPNEGHTALEKEYAAVKVADDVYVVSYLAASGYTLTVALSFHDHTMVGFASNESGWYPGKGTFEVVH